MRTQPEPQSELREFEQAMALKVFAGSAMTLAETNHLAKLRAKVKEHNECKERVSG